jgi:hypothetical protein
VQEEAEDREGERGQQDVLEHGRREAAEQREERERRLAERGGDDAVGQAEEEAAGGAGAEEGSQGPRQARRRAGDRPDQVHPR